MPSLQITIHDQVWPQVLDALTDLYGPVPDDTHPRDWAEQIAAQVFAETVASAAKPAPVGPPSRRFRPSQARS